MPLKAIGEAGWDESHSDNVFFFMFQETNAGERVRCAATRRTLTKLTGKPMSTSADRLHAFAEFRDRLEHVASAKFDRKVVDPNDKTVYVFEADLLRYPAQV